MKMTYQCTKFIQYGRGSLSNKRSQILVKMSTSTVFVFFFFWWARKGGSQFTALTKVMEKLKHVTTLIIMKLTVYFAYIIIMGLDI